MRKKILSLVMTACMVLSLLPAVSSPAAAIYSINYTVGETSIGNTDSGLSASASGDGWTWTCDETNGGMLTLDNAYIRGEDSTIGSSYGAYLPGGTTIVLKGDSTIAGGTATGDSCGVCCDGDLTIKNGETGGTVGSLTAVSGSSSYKDCKGLMACDGSNSAKINIVSGKVTGIGGTATDSSYGIYTDSLTVSGTADVSGIAGTANGSDSTTQSCGAFLTNGTVSGGSLTAVGGYASGSASYGVSTNSFNVSGGVVTAQGGKSASGNSYGVFSGSSASTVSGTGLLVAGSDACGSGEEIVSQALSAAPTGANSAALTGAFDGHFAVYGPSDTYTVLNTLDYTGSTTPDNVTGHITWVESDGNTYNTLTLNNVIINTADSAGANSALTIPVGTKIILNGTNIIHSGWTTSGDSTAIKINLDYDSAGMTIGGTGTLLASAGSAPAGATNVDSGGGMGLWIGSTGTDTPKVIAFAGSAKTESIALGSNKCNPVRIYSNVNVTAVGGYVSGSTGTTCGIEGESINLNGSSVVAVGGGCASGSSYGCYSDSSSSGVVTLSNSSKLTAVGDTNGIYCVNTTKPPIVLDDGSHITAMGGTHAATAAPTASGVNKFSYTDGGTFETKDSAVRFRAGGPVIAVSHDNGSTYKGYGDFVEGWNNAVGSATSESSPATVKLLADWTAAAAGSSNTSFGTGVGFGDGDSGSRGCILVPQSKSITLELNGHTIDRALYAEQEGGYVIDNLGTLTICDSATGGTVTGGYNSYNSFYPDKDGGGIRNKGTLTLTGGTITGNADTVMGGGVYNAAGAAFTMTGGKISANYAQVNEKSKCGGGVYNAGTFTMTGGEIRGNYSCYTEKDGGGVYNAGTFNVGGTAKITGNHSMAKKKGCKTASGGVTDNVYLPSGKTITCLTGANALANGASIGVSTADVPAANAPVDVTDGSSTDYSRYFHSDNSDNNRYHIYNDVTDANNQIVMLGDGALYNIFFDANGGSVTPTSSVTGTDFRLSDLPTPTYAGHTFDGWYDAATDGTKVTADNGYNADKVVYAHWTASGGGYVPSTPTTGNKAEPVIVDGTEHDIGTKTTTDTTTTVTVDNDKLQEQLESASDSVVVPITSKTDTTVAQLVVKNVEDMAAKDMTLSVDLGGIQYNIPSTAVQTDEVMRALGATDPSKVPVNVTITQLTSDAVTIKNGTLQVPPVQFTVTATYGGKTVETSVFTQYVSRIIELSADTDLSKITTAVVKEPDGAERHVPTFVYTKDGKQYAKINSLTNSTYALIYNQASFADAAGKWYENIVSEMASREILMGRDTGVFDGDASITRAEFAAVLVRALGLPASGTSSFTDVASTDWYAGAVGTASSYGLVLGYEDGSFGPNNNITRQEAMAMIARAAKVAEYAGKTSELTAFSDTASVSSWAISAAQYNVGSGLIVGDNGQLRPNDAITRAESATVVLRLLQKAGLVDVRSAT